MALPREAFEAGPRILVSMLVGDGPSLSWWPPLKKLGGPPCASVTTERSSRVISAIRIRIYCSADEVQDNGARQRAVTSRPSLRGLLFSFTKHSKWMQVGRALLQSLTGYKMDHLVPAPSSTPHRFTTPCLPCRTDSSELCRAAEERLFTHPTTEFWALHSRRTVPRQLQVTTRNRETSLEDGQHNRVTVMLGWKF